MEKLKFSLGERCWFIEEGEQVQAAVVMLAPICNLEDEYLIKLESSGRNITVASNQLRKFNSPKSPLGTAANEGDPTNSETKNDCPKNDKITEVVEVAELDSGPVFGKDNASFAQKVWMAFGGIGGGRSPQGYEKPSYYALEELRKLRSWLQASVEPDDTQAAKLLQRFWVGAFGPEEAFVPVDQRWLDIGFQRTSPYSDFRGGGLLSLKCLVYFAENHPQKLRHILRTAQKTDKLQRLPFAVAGINLTVAVCDLLGLTSQFGLYPEPRPYWKAFEDENTFFELFSIGIYVMDRIRVESKCGIMDFVAVLKWTQQELERLLEGGPKSRKELELLSIAVPGTRAQMELQRTAEVEAAQSLHEQGLLVEESNMMISQIILNGKLVVHYAAEGKQPEAWLELSASHEKGEKSFIFKFSCAENHLGLQLPTEKVLELEVGEGKAARFEGLLVTGESPRQLSELKMALTLKFEVTEVGATLKEDILEEKECSRENSGTESVCSPANGTNQENVPCSGQECSELLIGAPIICHQGIFDITIPLQLLFNGHPSNKVHKGDFPKLWGALPEDAESHKSLDWSKEKEKVGTAEHAQQLIEIIESFGLWYVTRRKVRGVPLLYFSTKLQGLDEIVLVEATLQQKKCGVCVKSSSKDNALPIFCVFKSALRGARADPTGTTSQDVVVIGNIDWDEPDSVDI